ncbi:flagellar protein FlaG [Aliiglaciecola lipolytica]|uniref:Flagellar protein FlaG n=1 Tax=Aliiglaciecola lipolytica E3 TaxID=1127673 RepID=K6YVA1_9ALTE|nr:flagellar protein FlaG [Aliiglaciecola lipolytica]GAC15190.1 flagellar protein FlaG [Aliiglaciecola lipolytica E3]
MDVNFSQYGQNFAQQEAVAPVSVNVTEQSLLKSEQKVATEQLQNGQEKERQADNNASNNESSLNIESAVSEISDFLQATNRQLSFSVDEKSERQVVKVTDSESGEVIRQIPSEEVLALSERIKELQSDVGSAVGVLLNKQA